MSRVFGAPPGSDFVRCLHDFLCERSDAGAPETLARIQVLVPTRRMQRRLKLLFEQSGNRLLPRIGLVSDVSHMLPEQTNVPTVSGLRRMLELKTVVSRLVELEGRLSRHDVLDLTASLTQLLDEMQGEGVSFDALEALSPNDHSGHWEQSLQFLRAIRGYVETIGNEAKGAEAVRRETVESLIQFWSVSPPQHPVVVAGSTGSRASTRMLMSAVASLPNGSVLLPGFDFDLPDAIWHILATEPSSEDHPQYRFASFLRHINCTHEDVMKISEAPNASLNRLISLSLRPAPVTDQWLRDGPELGQLPPTVSGLSLIEARDAKEESAAIALSIRTALDQDQSVALIAPDATLARRVAADLKRWNIVPDDSGGVPLSLTPAGRFLRQTARLAGGHRNPVDVMSLLKHPLTQFGVERGTFMRDVQEFELFLRKSGFVELNAEVVAGFSETHATQSDWLSTALDIAEANVEDTLSAAIDHHMAVVRAFAGTEGATALFANSAGEKVQKILAEFQQNASFDTRTPYHEYLQFLERALVADSVREQDGVRSDVMIWGTLEARVQGADVVILGGLNEGIWPTPPVADPWLNTAMRREVGLLLPERQIGLAAHDFQQAVGAGHVILSRSARMDGSETIPSRWLSRLMNLLNGLPETGGDKALDEMRRRGRVFLDRAALLDLPDQVPCPAARHAPAPEMSLRPREFAVTEIQKLIRDPYAVYARRVLRLKPLNLLSPQMDARLKGTVFHDILEAFFDPEVQFDEPAAAAARLQAIASSALVDQVPDVTTRVEWMSQLMSISGWLIEGEMDRRKNAAPLKREVKGTYPVPKTNFVLRGTADRIDRLHNGDLVIYDYKTGAPPSRKDIQDFDRQLILEAVMAEAGAFADLTPEEVTKVIHLGVGRTPKEQVTQLVGDNDTVTIPKQIAQLLSAFMDPEHGYVSRRAMESMRYEGDYDHLARYGEWDASMSAVVVKLQ